MTESTSRRTSIGEIGRNAAISMVIGVAVFFLIFIVRQELWGFRLALFGAVAGLVTYALSHSLDVAVGDRIRRRHLVPDKLVGVPLYFAAGILALLVTTAGLEALGVMPFRLTGRDLRLAVVISGVVSIVVGLLFYSFHVMRQRLRESIERIKEQEFAEKELQLARSIQKRLLPPESLSGEGYRINARNLAAQVVAGDFYDVFHHSNGALGIVVADVSGKGIGASLIMASVKAVLPLIAEGRRPAATLTELNHKLHGELAPREFVALAYARFEPRTGTLELTNAGLPDPYLLREGGGVEPLSVSGPRRPLGTRSEVAYESLRLTLHPGERLLLLTDGLPEAPTNTGGQLGYEALADLVSVAASEPGDLLDALFASVRSASQPTLDDDWTALLIQAIAVSHDATRA